MMLYNAFFAQFHLFLSFFIATVFGIQNYRNRIATSLNTNIICEIMPFEYCFKRGFATHNCESRVAEQLASIITTQSVA